MPENDHGGGGGFIGTLKEGGRNKWVLLIAFGVVAVVVVLALMKRAGGAQVSGALPSGAVGSSGIGTNQMPGTFNQSDLMNLVDTVSTQYQDFLNQIQGITSGQQSAGGTAMHLRQRLSDALEGTNKGVPVFFSPGPAGPQTLAKWLPYGGNVTVLGGPVQGATNCRDGICSSGWIPLDLNGSIVYAWEQDIMDVINPVRMTHGPIIGPTAVGSARPNSILGRDVSTVSTPFGTAFPVFSPFNTTGQVTQGR